MLDMYNDNTTWPAQVEPQCACIIIIATCMVKVITTTSFMRGIYLPEGVAVLHTMCISSTTIVLWCCVVYSLLWSSIIEPVKQQLQALTSSEMLELVLGI